MAITTSVLTGGSNNHETTSEEANAVYTDFVSEGIVGSVANTSGVAPATGGFAVNAQGTPDTTVAVSSGVAYVTGTPSTQNSQTFRVKNSASTNVTISANSSGSTKYDWVYIQLDATKLNTPNTAGDDVATIVTSRSSSAASDDGTPPTYGYPIAVVTVANGFSTITNSNIRDIRSQVALNTGSSNAVDGWVSLSSATALTTSSGYNKGNKEFDITSSTDMTGVLSAGMRLKVTRGTTPPTQCTSLNGSSQYWNKTSSLTAIAFTDDFVAGAWVYPTSYAAGAIISRYNGTSGWVLKMESTGQVTLVGYNAGASNYSQVQSYQSLPLNRWSFVAAQLDMSSFTATTTTSYIMIDGANVPAAVSRGGTNPTALVQAGNLEIGSTNGGTLPFPGKIAQAFLYSAKVTQANILDRMCQELTGSETNLIGYWKFNGNGNDSSASSLNLTAQGSATATTVDNPFNSTEYAIITKVTDSTVTVFTGNGYTIPNVTLSTPYYSTQKAPFGFPAQRNKWRVDTLVASSLTKGGASTGTWYNGGVQLSIPTGEWEVGYLGNPIIQATATAGLQSITTLSSSNSAESDTRFTMMTPYTNASSSQNQGGISAYPSSITTTAQTIYYINQQAVNGSGTINLYFCFTGTPGRITAYCSYL